VVDMSTSNSWAEFAGIFLHTREAHLEHERAKSELKALLPCMGGRNFPALGSRGVENAPASPLSTWRTRPLYGTSLCTRSQVSIAPKGLPNGPARLSADARLVQLAFELRAGSRNGTQQHTFRTFIACQRGFQRGSGARHAASGASSLWRH